MSKRVIYHPDTKYYDIEEKFRNKQGTKIFVYNHKSHPEVSEIIEKYRRK